MSSSRSLVTSTPRGLPIARMRRVFESAQVERRLTKLLASGNEREYESLKNTWQRMLERGPDRFAVKPAGVPDMAPLYDQLPNFGEVLDDVKRHVALAQDSQDTLEVTPMLLLGPPGVGKTHFARQMADLLGTGMTLARLGGDEFAVLSESCAQVGQAAALAQSIIDGLKEPFELDNHRLFTSVSIGISLFPSDALSAEQLLRNADSALFKAKNNGRSGYALYTEELTAHAQQRVETASELRRALEQEELRVYYQPVHDLLSGAMIGVEALVRWQHPERGLVPPGEFIPIAERTGLIAEIDAWVMRQACQQMVQWQADGKELAFVAVNVSSRLFAHRNLYQLVAQVLHETGLDPARLEVEVTESAVMDDPEVALEQLHRLRELGLQLAIDDFGTGYSSLLRLKRLPVQKLKIDQGFVAGLPHDDDDVAIVRVIIALARSMGMQVQAEGIEEAEQARFLLEQMCEMGQGYWYGRPVPAQQLRWP